MALDPLTEGATVLLSGGIDSATVLATLLDQTIAADCLFVDYGQSAIGEERRASAAIAEFYGCSWSVVTVTGISVGLHEIRGRNDFLVALGMAYSERRFVAVGTHAGIPYKDCSRSHHEAWQQLIDTQYDGVRRFVAPLQNLTKMQVWKTAVDLRVPLTLTYSCEIANGPCGACPSCEDRGRLLNVGS
ncbi:7-cyano-7-deazaguanine synthase [Streptomyces sp. NPDC101225]|uniref:7-cyano-7-deazaguanine synthase n=1 Tax=Streptomyces sp. NPDC101225 TaxID=3366135 RepID=UPI0037F83C25